MQNNEDILDLEQIKLLCILAILSELQRESVTEEFQKLNFKKALD